MFDKINEMISELCENGINAVLGYRHNNAQRPVKRGSAYVYPEKLECGRLYFAIDVYSPFSDDLSGCMTLAQDTARVLSSKINAQELVISRVSYDNNSMGYVSRITANTVCDSSGGVQVRFYGFKGNDGLIVNADIFDVKFETDFSPYPIYTIFNSAPVDVIYNKKKYTVTLKGVRGGLGSLLSSYGMFNMRFVSADEEFDLYNCCVIKSDEPFGSVIVIEGVLST